MAEDLSTAEAIMSLARAVQNLGNADAGTPLGGLEALGVVIKEGLASIAGGLSDVAEAIRDRLPPGG